MKHQAGVWKRVLLVALIACLGGCVSIDGRSLTEPIAKGSLERLAGEYRNKPTYISDSMFQGPGTFFQMVLPKDAVPASFTISYDEPKGLLIRYTIEGIAGVVERSFVPGKDLRVGGDGALHLAVEMPCGGVGSGDNFYLDCASRSVSVFVNPSGDLVAVLTTKEVANLLLLPVAKYVKVVAIFPRVKAQ